MKKSLPEITRLARSVSFLLILFVFCLGCAVPDRTPVPSAQVLFIGNSYTYYNGGLDFILTQLDPTIAAERMTEGGYRLQDHWNLGQAQERIKKKKWTYVVLQEQSQLPVASPPEYYEFAEKFSVAIHASGAEVILLMTWERPDSVSYGITTRKLADRINEAGHNLNAKVAPAGLAFESSLKERPDLKLYSADGHPTIHGSYLAACVLYRVITGKSPLQTTYSPPEISEKDREFLKKIAAM